MRSRTAETAVALTARFSHCASRDITVRDIAIGDLNPIEGHVRAQGRLDDEQIRQLAGQSFVERPLRSGHAAFSPNSKNGRFATGCQPGSIKLH